MTSKDLFKLNRLRTLIVLRELAQDWRPEIQGRLECPFCQSQKVYKRMQFTDGNTHICRNCGESFSEELVPSCRCWYPGSLQKCQDCLWFQLILPLLKQKVSSLQGLSLQELENLIGYCELPTRPARQK